MTIGGIVLRLVMGTGIGFSIGLSGIGGGVVVLPALALVLGLPATVAVGTASLYAFLTKLYATYEHLKLKTVDLHTSLLFLVGAVPGNLAAAWGINLYVGRLGGDEAELAGFQRGLQFFIAGVILVSVTVLVVDLWNRRGARSTGPGSPGGSKSRRILAVPAGAVVGCLMGATSVGGGVLLIPMLIIIFGLSSARTVGTSVFVGAVLTLVTSVVYGIGGQLDWGTGLLMSAGSIPGVLLGSRLCAKLPERRLRAIVIVIVLLAALLMLAKQGPAGAH